MSLLSNTVPPQVSVNASVVVVSRSDVVSVQCRATGIPTPHIQWIMSSTSRLVTVIPVTSTVGTAASTLRFVNAQPSDSGEIVCSAANKVGAANATIRLDVQCNHKGLCVIHVKFLFLSAGSCSDRSDVSV